MQLPARYTRSARFYDVLSLEWPVYRGGRLAADRRLGLRPGMRVLDLGCGTGLNHPLIQAAVGPGGSIVGVDSSRQMLDPGRAHGRTGTVGATSSWSRRTWPSCPTSGRWTPCSPPTHLSLVPRLGARVGRRARDRPAGRPDGRRGHAAAGRRRPDRHSAGPARLRRGRLGHRRPSLDRAGAGLHGRLRDEPAGGTSRCASARDRECLSLTDPDPDADPGPAEPVKRRTVRQQTDHPRAAGDASRARTSRWRRSTARPRTSGRGGSSRRVAGAQPCATAT